VNSLGIDVGKKKCRAALKDEGGDIIREFFSNNRPTKCISLWKIYVQQY
jgi:N-acetylglucosamine kinase-like BadF-type ATPase